MGGPATQHPPETLHHIALRTITRQPIQVQLGRGRSHVLHSRPTRPGSLIDRDDDLGRAARRIHTRQSAERHHKGRVQPLLFVLPQLDFAPCRLLE
jgi:hypothetical protein